MSERDTASAVFAVASDRRDPGPAVDLRTRVDRVLATFLSLRRTQLLGVDEALEPVADALDSFVLGSGKRLRPAFAYWAYLAAGGADCAAVVRAVSALELVHASALIHDDVMDSSEVRRGEPAIHRRFADRHSRHGWQGSPDGFGTAAAILLGDLCLVWSDELLHGSGLPAEALARARPVFDRMRTEVTVGQYLDVLTQASGETSEARAGQVARYKSAKYTVEHPMLLGGELAAAPAALLDVYHRFGLPLGEAFQLRDDVLGVFGDPAVTGKPAGDDLREGKRTYLVATALAGASADDSAALRAGLGDPGLTAQGVDRLREIMVRTGALGRTEQRIEALTASALDALDQASGGPGPLLDPQAAEVLARMARAATTRHH